MISSLNSSVLFYVIPLAVFSSSSMSAAQDVDFFNLSLKQLGQVEIYSADKTSEAIKDIPASVSIISRTEIKHFGYSTFTELLQNIPGLYLTTNIESTFLGIRGNSSGGIQLLVNGISQHPSLQRAISSTDHNQFNIPIESIDQIEVIRGPMSVIYGNNAFLGVINVITNDVERMTSSINVSSGTEDNGRIFARYGQQSTDGYLVINAGAHQTGGFSGRYDDMMNDADLAALASGYDESMEDRMDQQQVSLDISAKHKSLTANLRYQQMDYGLYAVTPTYGRRSDLLLNTTHVSLGYDSELSDSTQFKATVIYSDETYDLDNLSAFAPSINGGQTQTSRRSDVELNIIHTQDNYEIIGGYRYRQIDDVENDILVTNDPASPILDSLASLESYSLNELFGQVAYQLGESNRLVAGLRFLHLPSSYQTTKISRSVMSTTNRDSGIEDQTKLNWRLAWIHSIDANNQLRFLAGTAAHDTDVFSITESEEIITYEINHVATYDRLQISSSLFQNEINNILQREIDPITLVDTNTINGEWKTLGIEILAEYRATDNLRIYGSTTLQNTEDKNHSVEVGYSPRLLAKFKIDYSVEKYNLSAYANYVDAMKTSYTIDASNLLVRLGNEVPSYTMLGVNIRYNYSSGAFVSINISNLLDEEVRYAANEITENLDDGLIGMGRVMMLTAGYEF